MTLPSKYRSPNSRDFSIAYFIFLVIFFGGIAIGIYLGILNAVEKYGPAFLYGWTIQNIILVIGFSAISVLAVLISRQTFSHIIGVPWQNMNQIQKFISIIGSKYLLFVILAAGFLFVAILSGSTP